MESVKRISGKLYYGDYECNDADEAYRKFRDDYNRKLGKAVRIRLDRLGSRKERVHGFGFVREDSFIPKHCGPSTKTRYNLIGLYNLSYWWNIDISQIDEDIFEDWVEFALTKKSGALTQVGRSNRKKKKKRQPIKLNFDYGRENKPGESE